MQPEPIRILIVDDHPLVREGLRARLSSVAAFEVVGEAQDAKETLELLGSINPHLVLTDIGMRELNGIELTRLVVQHHPGVAVLVLSMHDSAEYVCEAMQAGARGYVLKDAPSEQIIAAIHSVVSGGIYLSPAISSRLFGPKAAEISLSLREQQILRSLARGLSSKQMAKVLDISVRTVESHRQSIKRKLNMKGQAELIKFAVEQFRL